MEKRYKYFDYKDIYEKMNIISDNVKELKKYQYNLSFLLDFVEISDIENYLRKEKLKKIK